MTKYVVQKAPIQGGQNYESIAERLVDNIFRADDSFREDVNTALVGRLNITQTFIDRLTFFYGSKSREQFEFILGEIGVGNAAQIKQQVDNISKRLGVSLRSGLDLDHQDITYINTRTAIVINLLQGALAEIEDDETFGTGVSPETGRFVGQLGGRRGGAELVKRQIKELQKQLAFMERLAAQIDSYGNIEPGTIDKIIKDLEEQSYIKIDKEKYVAALDGKAEVKFGFTTPKYNQRQKGRVQEALGKIRNATLRNYDQTLTTSEQKLYEKLARASFEVEGSKRVDAELIDQLTAAFMQRRAKVYKSASTKKFTPKRASTGKLSGVKRQNSKAATKKRNIVAELQAYAAATKAGKEVRQKPTGQRRLNILKENINRKLPDAVEANMGRPGLEYQSGRFANSVKLDNLIQGPKTVIGEYSYMENPYATFENSDRWPSGYNPRPLITKSIRELAQKALGNKFTLRKA